MGAEQNTDGLPCFGLSDGSPRALHLTTAPSGTARPSAKNLAALSRLVVLGLNRALKSHILVLHLLYISQAFRR
jgi:hypothetical protein